MENPLIKYIKECKNKNITDEEIIKNLTSKGWPIEKIYQAFLRINSAQIPQNPIPQLIPTTPLTSINKINPSAEKKSKIIDIISIIIFLIAFLYVRKIFDLLEIIIIMEQSGVSVVVNYILKYFPAFGILPVLFSCVTLAVFYLAFKIRDGSKKSFWLDLPFLLIVPPLSSLITLILMMPVMKLGAALNSTVYYPLKSINFNFIDPIFFLDAVSIILLITSYKKFNFENNSLSKKAKVFLIMVSVVIFVPVTVLISSNCAASFSTDYGYAYAKTRLNYHIYRPSPLPDNLVYTTIFILGMNLAGKQNGVRVAFDTSLDKILKGDKAKPIVITQVAVDPGFDLYKFTETYTKDTVPQKVKISNAVDKQGYLYQNKFVRSSENFIVFLTKDNIFISLSSSKVTPEELIRLAETLK